MSFDLTMNSDLDTGIQKITEALKTEGFGVLTRIDFDQKIKEKLGHTLPRTVILGACNPTIAYEAYVQDPNMLLLVPCNVVVTETSNQELSARFIKPSAMLKALENPSLLPFAKIADLMLEKAVTKI